MRFGELGRACAGIRSLRAANGLSPLLSRGKHRATRYERNNWISRCSRLMYAHTVQRVRSTFVRCTKVLSYLRIIVVRTRTTIDAIDLTRSIPPDRSHSPPARGQDRKPKTRELLSQLAPAPSARAGVVARLSRVDARDPRRVRATRGIALGRRRRRREPSVSGDRGRSIPREATTTARQSASAARRRERRVSSRARALETRWGGRSTRRSSMKPRPWRGARARIARARRRDDDAADARDASRPSARRGVAT